MSTSSAVIQSRVGGILPGPRPVPRRRHADVPSAGDLAAVDLIAPGRALELPSLFGVEDEYIYNGGTTGVCELCKQLLRLEIGTLADWEESQHTPLKFIHLTLRHWMEKSAAPYSVGNSFGLELFLHNWIDEWSDSRRGADQVSRLYLMLDCSEVEAFNIGKLYDSLYRIHPRLPVSFYQRFVHGCCRWFRVWDHKDLTWEIECLAENYEDANDRDTAAAWKADIPRYMNRKPLPDRDYNRIVRKLSPRSKFRRLLELAAELHDVSHSASPMELTQDERDSLDNHGNSYPVFSLHFYSMDAVRATLDSEGNLIMQSTPLPNTIIPFTLDNDEEMEQAFQVLAVASKVIGIAAAITKYLPYSE